MGGGLMEHNDRVKSQSYVPAVGGNLLKQHAEMPMKESTDIPQSVSKLNMCTRCRKAENLHRPSAKLIPKQCPCAIFWYSFILISRVDFSLTFYVRRYGKHVFIDGSLAFRCS